MAEADEVVAWEACKENAQPIRQGRRAAALKALAHDDADQRVARRAEWEQALKQAAAGADPLASWVAYVKWTQEAYVTGGKDARLLQLLEDCAYGFKDDVRYTDDQRYLRIWIQYADMVRDPEPIFDYLYDRHIGQNHALFWEAWASVLEVKRKYSAADKARARPPIEVLVPNGCAIHPIRQVMVTIPTSLQPTGIRPRHPAQGPAVGSPSALAPEVPAASGQAATKWRAARLRGRSSCCAKTAKGAQGPEPTHKEGRLLVNPAYHATACCTAKGVESGCRQACIAAAGRNDRRQFPSIYRQA